MESRPTRVATVRSAQGGRADWTPGDPGVETDADRMYGIDPDVPPFSGGDLKDSIQRLIEKRKRPRKAVELTPEEFEAFCEKNTIVSIEADRYSIYFYFDEGITIHTHMQIDEELHYIVDIEEDGDPK